MVPQLFEACLMFKALDNMSQTSTKASNFGYRSFVGEEVISVVLHAPLPRGRLAADRQTMNERRRADTYDS
jgi:hypothetical protein